MVQASDGGLLSFARHRRTIEELTKEVNADPEHGHGELSRSLGFWSLTMLSIGAMVGTGIFFVLGSTVSQAGPGVIVAFAIAGLLSILSALSYAELVSAIPTSGSAFSYSYALFGHFAAWMTGVFLTMEYGMSISAVAVGWGTYINDFLVSFGGTLPEALIAAPGSGGIINLPALLVIFLAAILLLRGISESAAVNSAMVVLKFLILGFFVVVAFGAFTPDHFSPFLPEGMAGVWTAAGAGFFAFIGFDTASTAAEEARNPSRDVPWAIITAVLVVLGLYIAVAVAAIGAYEPSEFEPESPILSVIARAVTGGESAARFISAGAAMAIFTVVLAVLYGQTRITFAMARDGFLPYGFEKLNQKAVPSRNVIGTAAFFALLAALVPIGPLLDVTVAGCFLAFMMVHLGVLVRRRTRPDLHPKFTVPLGPVVPVCGFVFCVYLLYSLGPQTLLYTALICTAAVVWYLVRFRGSRVAAGKAVLRDGRIQ